MLIYKKYIATISVVFSLIGGFYFSGCTKTEEPPVSDGYEVDEEYTAGKGGTTFDASINAFNNSIPTLTDDDNILFVTGNSFNRNNWVIAPSSTSTRDGLGPVYNALSCSGCHFLDGRGQPSQPGQATLSMVYRMSIAGTDVHGEPLGHPDYGDQLNNKSIPNVENEGDVNLSYETVNGQYPDGTSYSLRKPVYVFQNPDLSNVYFSPRVAPVMSGLGFIDAIPEQAILAHADENDKDGDGISGKPNFVWDIINQKSRLGRIGWKANIASVKQQVAHAFLNDIGITSHFLPNENLHGKQITAYGNLPTGGNPEISDTIFNAVYFYVSTLAMPARRNYKQAEVLAGKKLFNTIGCVKCHVSTYQTSSHPDFNYLNNQTIHPYSDFLLHDMGPALADNRTDFQAGGQEWRTAPLWGNGLVPVVNGHNTLLHDGRARGTEEAILWHGGEATSAKMKFMNLSKAERTLLLTFLKSL